jgi:hypothetical protein
MDIKTKAITKIAAQLKALDCEFMIIPKDGDPIKVGDFTYEKPLKHGTVRQYIMPFLETIKPGESAQIPYADLPHSKVMQGASSAAHATFGAGNYVTQSTDTHVEVLCLSRDEAE